MRGRSVGIFGLVCGVLIGAPASADPPEHASQALFESYCGGCHSLGASDGGRAAPDLSQLAGKYGAPLPQDRLVDFVTTRRRPGAQHICNAHVWSNLSPVPFRDHMEQLTVRAALEFVASQQAAE